MARIRSIHPGIFTDEQFVLLSFPARQAILGLLTEADDAGIFEWKPVSLKMRLFPADAVDMAELMAECAVGGWLLQYEVDGKVYGAVRNFCKWQRPKKPSYKLPRNAESDKWVQFPTEAALTATSSPPVPHQFPTSGEKSPQMEEVGGRREEVGKKKPANRAEPAPPVELEFAWRGKTIRLLRRDYEAWRRNYPNVDLDAELQAADDYYTTNTPKGGNWFFAASAWMKRANAGNPIRDDETRSDGLRPGRDVF